MANFTALKTAINNAIKTNGNEEITGAILQAILDAMVETLGDSAINDLENAITTEVTNRENAVGGVADDLAAEALARANKDNQLDNRINQEESNRQNADAALSQTMSQGFQTLGSQMTALNAAISALNAAYQNGYLYGGIATPSSSPSNNKCFYIALQGGTYTNFGGVGVVEGINIIKNDSGWKVEHIYDQTTLLNEFYLLRQQVIQAITSFAPIVIEGDVTNAPDEEDLTSNANHLLQFKNNAYSPLEFSGLGRKYLRKNIAPLSESAPFNGFVEGVTAEETLSGTPTQMFWDRMNTRFVGIKDGVYYLDWTDSDNYVPVSTNLVYMYNGTPYQWTGSDFIVDETEVPNLVNCLTQDMINEANTIYIIRYDYTLKEDITIPANCVLQFDGGSISGNSHNVGFDDTYCEFADEKTGFTNCTFSGNLQNRDVYVDNYGASPSLNDNADILNNIFGLSRANNSVSFHKYIFGKGTYKIIKHLELWFNWNNRSEVCGGMNTTTILQMTDNTPIFVCREFLSLHDLQLKYNSVQTNANTKAIAIGFTKLTISNIYNLFIYNAYTCIGGVVNSEDTEFPTTEVAIVNANIHDIYALGISGWFLNIKNRNGEGVTSGMYMTNIYMHINDYNIQGSTSCKGFANFSSNSECTIGNINIEGGIVSDNLIRLGGYAMITVEHLHIEGVTLSYINTFELPGYSFLKIESLDFDYNTKYSGSYPFMFNMQGGEVIVDSLNLLNVEGGFSITTALWIVYASYTNNSIAIINRITGLPEGATLYREESNTSCKFILEGELYNTPRKVGTTAQRPTLKPKDVGFQYFDKTLNKPIYYTLIVDKVIDIPTSSSYEVTESNSLIPGNTYYIKFLIGNGQFGYKDSQNNLHNVSSWINPGVETEFTALDYPYFYIHFGDLNISCSVYTKNYGWVDATGTTV